jgi:hypothetical protein
VLNFALIQQPGYGSHEYVESPEAPARGGE